MAATNDLTRQQLDELDLLLQRMLKPTEPLKTQAEPQHGWRADPPANEASPHLSELPAANEPITPLPPMPLPDISSAMPFAPSPMLPVERPKVPSFVPPTPEPVAEEFGKLELAVLTPAEEPLPAEPLVKPLPMLAWPMAAMNWMIESVLKLFGPPGAILTGKTGKNLLGFAGVLMIAGAGLWTAQGLGWIRLPLPR